MDEPYQSPLNLPSKYNKHTLILCFVPLKTQYFHLYVYFGLPTINRMFFVTLKPLNMLDGTLFVVSLRLNTLFLIFFPAAWPEPTFFLFNLEKNHSYFAFSFVTTVNLFYCLLWGFRTLNTYTIGCLFRLLPFCKQLTSKNINSNLFVACFSVNNLFPPLHGF